MRSKRFVRYHNQLQITNKVILLLGYVLVLIILFGSLPVNAVGIPSSTLRGDSTNIRWDDVSCSSNYTPEASLSIGGITQLSENRPYESIKHIDNTESMVYVALTIPLGQTKEVDCGRLYNLALRTKEAELQQLKAKLALLEHKQSLNTFEE